jgi:hypothetical protein
MASAAAAWTGGWVMPDVRIPRGAFADRLVSQKSGPGKYAPSGTAGLKTMWGTIPLAHWASNRVTSSCRARGSSYHERPMAMDAESQLHWCG